MLYEVIIGNYCDDSTKSKLVLSYDSLDIVKEHIKTMITIHDGEYILELQVAPFENDASPSRPLLYKINQIK